MHATAWDDERLTTWGLVMEATARINRELERELQEALGIPLTFFEVLLRLGRTPGAGVALNALATQVSFSSGGFSRLVDRMEAQGLVQRRPCPSNRRSTLVALTETGRSTLDTAVEVHGRGLQRLLHDRLDADQLRVLDAVMRTLREADPR